MAYYNLDELDTAKTDIEYLKGYVKDPSNHYSGLSIDSRLIEYYSGYFGPLKSAAEDLEANSEQLGSLADWLDQLIADLRATKIETETLAGGLAGTLAAGGEEEGGDEGDGDGEDPSTITTTEEVPETEEDPNPPGGDPTQIEEETTTTEEEDPTKITGGKKKKKKKKKKKEKKDDGGDPTAITDGDDDDGSQNDDPDSEDVTGLFVPPFMGGDGDDTPDNFTGENPDFSTIVDPLQQYVVDPDAFASLPAEEQEAIIDKLREVGYTDQEIEDIINGRKGIPAPFVSEISGALEDALKDHPELRDEIKNLYGFDIFNDDGSINYTKLAMAIFTDMKDPNDKYDLIKLLYEKYGIELVPRDELMWLAEELMRSLQLDPDLRRRLLELYGFDIFNPDGTINYYNLIIAMLMDKVDPNDKFNLLKYLINVDVKGKKIPLSILIALGLAAAATGVGVAVEKKRKRERERKE